MKVVPGALLGTEEEVMAGANAVQDGSDIVASATGEAEVKSKVASVRTKGTGPVHVKPGDIIVGRVAEIFEPVALIDMGMQQTSEGRQVAPPGYAVLHASRVRDGYVKNVHDEVKIGDIVKGRVDDIRKEDVLLTVNERELGVIIAFCTNCRAKMEKKGAEFYCAACDSTEKRKAAEA
ncbi:MAG: exosome complex RNA-binding protein Csl4 [Candidatus Burarchaeum sp.]|nr:exosome complex RNA-binding protein Csl4 [Candidatus Burarchaeum sp.]MDO8339443.1 exosome complex RNA-binding protein Csl4 [Candidatus Burarchaeum sp.]